MRPIWLSLAFAFACFVSPVFAQLANSGAVTISGLERPIQPGGFALVHVVGMPEAEIQKASIGVSPSVPGILTVRLSAPADAVYLVAVTPGTIGGKYSFVISLNPWRRHLDEAVATPLGMDEADAKKLAALAAELGKKYTFWSASAVLEVSGTIPFPPPKPPPIPPGPSRGLVTTIIIRIVDTLTADQTEVLSNLREWSDQQPHDKVAHLEFPPDAKDPSGSLDARVAGWVAKIPSTAKQPYVFVSQPGDSGKNVVVWQGELPRTADELIAKIKERM